MPRKKKTEENPEITETSTDNTINENMKMEDSNNETIQKPKIKRERTQKQKDAFAKAQEAIKAKRLKAKEDKNKRFLGEGTSKERISALHFSRDRRNTE